MGSAVIVGPGDDCAVVRPVRGVDLLLTTDQLIEGRHYTPETPIDLIARKAIARSVSDIAAMGGRPLCALAAASLNTSFDQADELFDAMASWATRWACPLVGGDIAMTDGPTTLTVTIVGRPHNVRGPVLRADARPGDRVCVTGSLGGSLASGRHLTFEPRLDEATWLCDTLGDRLGALIDLSDGLGRDAGRIAAASNGHITLDAAAIPLADDVSDWRFAVGDGEDYELCFTVRGEAPTQTPTGVPIAVVGVVETGSGCLVQTSPANGVPAELIDVSNFGWDHHT